MTALRLAFMGTPDFAVPALHALAAAGHQIAAVYCQPPRPAGRGMAERKSSVQLAAEALGIPVRTPKSLKKPAVQQEFAELKLDAAIVAAYGLILPPAILAAPRLGCINIHASLLPRWRGAAPIHRALLAGDTDSGITIMQMDEGLDTGPMLERACLAIRSDETAETLHDRLAALGAGTIVRTLSRLVAGRIKAIPQPAEGVTYAAKLTRADGVIDWQRPAAEIERQVRALTPWPGTAFALAAESIKLAAVTAVPGDGPPGTILDAATATVACGHDALRLDRVQRPGRAWTDGPALLRGLRLATGARLA